MIRMSLLHVEAPHSVPRLQAGEGMEILGTPG
jgi:hypothetical protein